jgi:oxaloacetate decarboxylase beta subunit
MNTIIDSLQQFLQYTGFANMTWQHALMILIGIAFITVAIKKDWEPLLLVPIGFGMIIGNIPLPKGCR